MATGSDLRKIALARLKSAEVLIKAKDWQGAGYMLGYVLECSLKAVICKHLRLATYPDNIKPDAVRAFFMTHKFDQLLIVSGLQDTFSAAGIPDCFQHWSDFTVVYPGDWPSMRYDQSRLNQFDELKVRGLHVNLTEDPNGIITTIRKRRKW